MSPGLPVSGAGEVSDTILQAGSLVMVDLPGRVLTQADTAFLVRNRIRAVCLFRRNLGSEDEIRTLCRQLRAAMGPDALIALDQEGGSVLRVTSLPQAPGAMALGACADPALAFQVGAAVARGLRQLGINWNFAPVLDVNNNPGNPVIADRSFGETPGPVTLLAGAWMAGAASEGVACCVKHFPGHGDTTVDSHHDLPVVAQPRERLEAVEFAPFRALLTDTPAIMTAHIVYPALDPDLPATLSPAILTRLLRQEWGYDGVVITDSLVMKAIHARFGHPRAAVMAVNAGADMVMALGPREEQQAALDALAVALAGGVIPLHRYRQALERLHRLSHALPTSLPAYSGQQRQLDEDCMRGAWARALHAHAGAQPPARAQPLRVVAQKVVPSDGVAEAGLSADQIMPLFAGFPDVLLHAVDSLMDFDPRSLPVDGRSLILVSNHRQRYGAFRAQWHVQLHLVLWNPYQALDIEGPTVISWGYANGALAALKDWLEGRLSARGKAPVTLHEH